MPLTPAQHARRAHGIGASEAAACIGLSRYSTMLDIYRRKKGIVADGDQPSSEMMIMGTDIETVIVARYERETGLRGTAFPDTMVNPQYPWLFAHLDWLGDDRVTDCKLHGGGQYGEVGTDEVPQEVICQLHQQMIVAERDFAQVAAFVLVPLGFGRSKIEYRTYDVPFNRVLADEIIDGTRDLWQRIETDDPPPATSLADEVKLYTHSTESVVVATPEIMAAHADLLRLSADAKVLAEEATDKQLLLKCFMGDAAVLESPDGVTLATWRSNKDSERVDLALLRERFPRAVQRLMKVQPGGRVFLAKGSTKPKGRK